MRNSPIVDLAFTFGPFRLIPSQQVLVKGDEPVKLGGRALDILHLLVRRAGEEISKDDLIAFAWPQVRVEEHNLKVHVSSLRRALGDTIHQATYLATIVGHGYQFVAPVHAERIGTADQPDDDEVPCDLPDLTALIGRQRDIEGVARALDFARLVTLVGPGGVGKTSLAIAVGHLRREHFPGGVRFVDFATTDDPAQVPRIIARCLGIRDDGADVTSVIADYLQERRMLLLLDNCEHVLSAAASIADRLSDRKMRSCLLATSREPLGVIEENIQLIEPLAYPPNGEVGDLQDALGYPSVELFAQRAVEYCDYHAGNDDVPIIIALCEALDGLPLAIEIVAAKLNEFTPKGLLKSISRNPKNLSNARPEAHLRQRTLWSTIDWSFRLLSSQEANIYRLLSVFAGSFGWSDVAFMTRLLDSKPYQTTTALGGLVSKSLLTAEVNGETICYRLLESARQYASDALNREPIDWHAQQQHARLVLTVFERSVVEWDWFESKVWRKRYANRVGDLRKALDWCFGANGDPSLGIDLTVAALRFWNEQSSIFEQLFQVRRALTQCATIAGSELREVKLAESLGFAMTFARKPRSETDAAWEMAFDLAQRSGDAGRLLSAMFGKANYLVLSGRIVEGLSLLDRFMALAREERDLASLHDGERLAAQAKLHLGDFVLVQETLERLADDLAHGVAPSRITRFHKERYASTYSALALSTWLTGHRAKGLAMTKDLVQNLGSGDQLRGQSSLLAFVALPLALWSGEIPLMKSYLGILGKNLERENIDLWDPVYRFYGAFVRHAEGEHHATAAMQSAIDDLVADEILIRTPIYQGILAEALLTLGMTIEADRALKVAFSLQRRSHENWCLPELLRIKARIFCDFGKVADAREAIAEALKCAELAGALSFQVRILEDMVRMADADRDHVAAAALRSTLTELSFEAEVPRETAPGLPRTSGRPAPRSHPRSGLSGNRLTSRA